MDAGSWVTPVALLWVIAAVILAGFGLYWLANKRRRLGIGMVSGAVLLVAVPLAMIAWWPSAAWWADKQQTVTVQGLGPTDPPFAVDIAHVMATHSSSYYSFWGAGDEAHVLAVFEAQHPDGRITDPSVSAHDPNRSLWHLSTDKVRYELVTAANDANFAVVTQVATLESEDGTTVVRIPYPATTFGGNAYEVTTLASDWTDDDWRAFYADIGDAQISGNTITVPTDTDLTATITLNGDSVNFHIND